MSIPKTKLTSKVTQKYQATIPQAVREKLEIEKGDRVIFEIEDEKEGLSDKSPFGKGELGSPACKPRVVLKKVSTVDWEYLESVSATLSEWSSDADEEAYSDL
jgi:AbrB family looped-hinge helix DNA binding protein